MLQGSTALPEADSDSARLPLFEVVDGHPLRIRGSLTINECSAFRDELLRRVARASALTVDISEVSACDAAAMQILIAAKKTMLQTNRQFSLTGLPPGIEAVAMELGIALNRPAAPESSGGPDIAL